MVSLENTVISLDSFNVKECTDFGLLTKFSQVLQFVPQIKTHCHPYYTKFSVN